jgi:hypothetical protein
MKRVQQQVFLPPKYWEALKVMSERKGFPSRQSLVEKLLMKYVDMEPEILAYAEQRLRAQEEYLEKKTEVDLVLPEVGYGDGRKMFVLTYKDGRKSLPVTADSAYQAYKILHGGMKVTVSEFNEQVVSYETKNRD